MASESTNRIAKNTIYLYIRQFISIVITLATVGITLDVLGEVDYGINNVVAGVVTMFTFLTGAMAIGNERFYAYYLGLGDMVKLKRIVAGTFGIYVTLSVIFFVLGETVGLWMLNYKLVIPPERMFAANWLFQLSLLILCIGMIMPPFTALIGAHEDMGFLAKMSIWDASAKLLSLFFLVMLPFDKLIALGCITLTIFLIGQFIYFFYCYKKYTVCHTWPKFEKPIIKELLGFNVWNLCGNFAWMIKNQGTAFLLNVFFGPVVNAAQGIATGLRGHSMVLAGSFQAAMTPQITKNYASGNHDHMFSLAFGGIKIEFMLMGVVVIPAFFNIELILNLWLSKVPQHTVVFCQLMLLEVLFEATSTFLATIQQATGRIKKYQLLIGLYGCLNLPISYVALKLGAVPEWVFAISLVMQFFVIGVRVGFLNRVRAGAMRECFRKVIFPCLTAFVVIFALCFMIPKVNNLVASAVFILLEIAIVVVAIYLIAFNKAERELTKNYVNVALTKIKLKRKSDEEESE